MFMAQFVCFTIVDPERDPESEPALGPESGPALGPESEPAPAPVRSLDNFFRVVCETSPPRGDKATTNSDKSVKEIRVGLEA